PSTRLKLDIDLAPREADTKPLAAELSYPEWDWKRQAYHRDYCRVLNVSSPEEGGDWTPDAVTQRNIRKVRRQFEALRSRRQTIQAQPDGDDLDLSMLVRDVAGPPRRGSGHGPPLYRRATGGPRSLARGPGGCLALHR